MSRDELSVMDGNKCILQLRGVRPFLSDKFDITKHKRYRELSDYDEKNAFDVEAYMKHQLKIRRQGKMQFYIETGGRYVYPPIRAEPEIWNTGSLHKYKN